MAFEHVQYDVEIVREIDPRNLSPVDSEDADDDSGLGCNRLYRDLRGMGWDQVKEAIEAEATWLTFLAASADIEQAFEELEEERVADPIDPLWNLDIGVAALTLAISACGGVPFTCCNAGAVGGCHAEAYPLVAFKLPPKAAPILLEVAEATGTGVRVIEYGDVVIYGRTILDMHNAAKVLFDRRDEVDGLFASA